MKYFGANGDWYNDNGEVGSEWTWGGVGCW